MRHAIVARLMAPPNNLKITAATDQARLSPEYVELSAQITTKVRQWEEKFTWAEFYRLSVELDRLDIQRSYDKQNAAAELGRLGEMIEQRRRTIG